MGKGTMNRDTNVTGIRISINDGVNPTDLETLKAGAKDGLSGTNDTVPFSGSESVLKSIGGSAGGMNSQNR